MPSLLDEIEPLKQSALAELTSAPDPAALERAKGNWIGTHGRFSALMKQLGSLPKGDRPAAGKRINEAKIQLEAALAARRQELDRLHLAGAPPLHRQTAPAHASDRGHRAQLPQDWLRRCRWT